MVRAAALAQAGHADSARAIISSSEPYFEAQPELLQFAAYALLLCGDDLEAQRRVEQVMTIFPDQGPALRQRRWLRPLEPADPS
ncbi:MAG: hypothetical protein WEF86_00430 [Gemmatimonadota bacterium]